jgi:hypothetical protein
MSFLNITRTIRVEKGKELSEAELNAAFAVPMDDRLWRALHQLIDTAEANAHENAWASMDPPGILAGYVGGAAHLKMLDELKPARGWDKTYRRGDQSAGCDAGMIPKILSQEQIEGYPIQVAS